MPAITKDEAIKAAFEAIAEKYAINVQPVSQKAVAAGVKVPYKFEHTGFLFNIFKEGVAATEHITEAAATQAAEKPQDGLVNPPSRAEPAANACGHCGRLPTDPEYCDWIECPGNSAEVAARFRNKGGVTKDIDAVKAAHVHWRNIVQQRDYSGYNRIGKQPKYWLCSPDIKTFPIAVSAEPDRQLSIMEAAQAVIDRWDSPKWKDEPHTAVFIERLRAALKGTSQ